MADENTDGWEEWDDATLHVEEEMDDEGDVDKQDASSKKHGHDHSHANNHTKAKKAKV